MVGREKTYQGNRREANREKRVEGRSGEVTSERMVRVEEVKYVCGFDGKGESCTERGTKNKGRDRKQEREGPRWHRRKGRVTEGREGMSVVYMVILTAGKNFLCTTVRPYHK